MRPSQKGQFSRVSKGVMTPDNAMMAAGSPINVMKPNGHLSHWSPFLMADLKVPGCQK